MIGAPLSRFSLSMPNAELKPVQAFRGKLLDSIYDMVLCVALHIILYIIYCIYYMHVSWN